MSPEEKSKIVLIILVKQPCKKIFELSTGIEARLI